MPAVRLLVLLAQLRSGTMSRPVGGQRDLGSEIAAGGLAEAWLDSGEPQLHAHRDRG
jgi:hypothetical protein